MKRLFVGFLGGILVALLAAYGYTAARYLQRMPSPSEAALHQPLQPMQVDPSWIQSGVPIFHVMQYAESPDGRSATGIWSCEGPTTFEWQFSADETVHVLDGRVEIDYLDQHFVLEPGGSAVFHAGTRAVWRVPKYVRKSYTLHYPNLVVRWVRSLSDMLDSP